MERLSLLKALLMSAVLVVCSGEQFVVDASNQITKLFNIFAEKQSTVIEDLQDIKDIITDIEISGTSNAALEEIKTKLESVSVILGKTQNFCERSNDVLGSFIDVLSIDECQSGDHNCHKDANCENLLIEYECSCKEGFSGDGVTCEDVNECSQGTHQCDSHASCSNLHGNYSCSCNPGYIGGGYTCEERKICSINSDCQPNSSCKNVGGNKKYCFCKDGYLGDGRTCDDVNECEKNSYECHPLATCKNIQGSYSCICNLGYHGDGRTCEDSDECQGSHDCPSIASCSNTYGSFSCSCNSGYLGDGYTCEDVDECEENLFECQPNASCKNIPGNYICQCNPGFLGDGHICEDVDECLVGHDCHSNATCSNNVGNYSCSCKPGYKGDGYQCDDMCPFDRVHGAGCIFFDEEEKTWADSWDNCQKHGGNLFLARTVTQFSRLRQYLREKTPVEVPDWTGLWVGVQEKTWLDGRVVSNEEWNEEHCHSSGYCCGAVMSGPPNYRLNNDPCEWSRPFICQWNETSSQLEF